MGGAENDICLLFRERCFRRRGDFLQYKIIPMLIYTELNDGIPILAVDEVVIHSLDDLIYSTLKD